MSATETPTAPAHAPAPGGALAHDVLAHLHAQIASVQGLLEIVLEQGAAIRARDVHQVVRLAGLLHGELARREQIERRRALLLGSVGARLGIEPGQVSVTRLTALMEPAAAEAVGERSARLRGLLQELRAVHACNRAVMKIELSFLDHLMQSLELDHRPHGYDGRGCTERSARGAAHGALHVLDLQA